MKLLKPLLFAISAVIVVSVIAIIAYNVGKNSIGMSDSSQVDKLAELEARESDVSVQERVSTQMSEIAMQQKAISDKQRERAEQQSRLATEMRNRAEQESKVAREAERKAILAAREADIQRANALNHQKKAEEQRDQAKYAQRVTDTLSYQTLGRTLGSLAIIQNENGNSEIAQHLAYLGWWFVDKYNGITYQPEIFKSLSETSGSITNFRMQKTGRVTAISPLTEKSFVAVSDYGEISKFTMSKTEAESKVKTIMANNTYDFRDVYAESKSIYALSVHGPLCVIGAMNIPIFIQLKYDIYMKLLHIDRNTLLIVGQKSLWWFNLSDNKLVKFEKLKSKLTCAVQRGNVTSLFFADGSYAEMDKTGKITQKKPLAKSVIYSAYYDEEREALFIGSKNGNIVMLNKYNHVMTIFSAHFAQITEMTVVGDVLVSGAYDKTLLFGRLSDVKYTYGLSLKDELQAKPNAKEDNVWKGRVNTRMNPISIDYETWPLVVCKTADTEALIGLSKGQIQRMNISIASMAYTLRSKLTRNFTRNEWNTFVGENIPYVKY